MERLHPVRYVSRTVTEAVRLVCDCGEPWIVVDDEGSIGVPTCRCSPDDYWARRGVARTNALLQDVQATIDKTIHPMNEGVLANLDPDQGNGVGKPIKCPDTQGGDTGGTPQ